MKPTIRFIETAALIFLLSLLLLTKAQAQVMDGGADFSVVRCSAGTVWPWGWIFSSHLDEHEGGLTINSILNWIELSLFVLSVILLTIIYFTIRTTIRVKNVSLELLAEQKLLQSIVDNTSNPIHIKKLNGEYLLVNKQFETLFQIASEKIIGKTDHDFLPKKTADTYRDSDIEVVKALRELKIEETIQQSDGLHTYVAVKFPLFDSFGRVYAIGGILEDITKKKVDEEKIKDNIRKLKLSEQQIHTIFDSAPDPVIVIDNESKILKWNPKAELVFGWKESEVDGKPMYEFIVPTRYREMHKKGVEKFLSTGIGSIINKTTEIEAVNKEGTEFPVALSISSAKIGEKNVFIGFVRDITANKKVISELYKQKEMLRLVLENIAEGVVVANANKKIVMANDIANTIFGIQEDEQFSLNLTNHYELYYPDEKTIFPAQNLPMEHAFNGELIDDVDVVLWDPVGKQKKRVLISGRPLIDKDDKVVAAVVTIKDISKYKQLEAELKEAELKYRKLIGFKTGKDKAV